MKTEDAIEITFHYVFFFNVSLLNYIIILVKHCFVLNSPMVCDQSASIVVCACLELIHP